MYQNSHFEEKDADKVLAFMQAHPFVTLIGFDGQNPVATQIPVHIYNESAGMRIVGHVMKKTDHYQAYLDHPNVLVLFTGAHAYISASVYENPAVASTWNYNSVQVKGIIRLMDNEETRTVIKHLTDSYENPANSSAAFHKMDNAYIEKNLKAISGFEITVESIANVFKLSQNHPHLNRQNIVSQLSKSDEANDKEVARQMKDQL